MKSSLVRVCITCYLLLLDTMGSKSKKSKADICNYLFPNHYCCNFCENTFFLRNAKRMKMHLSVCIRFKKKKISDISIDDIEEQVNDCDDNVSTLSLTNIMLPISTL